jgi:hypothetical protein
MTRLRGTELIRHCIGRLLLRRRLKVRSNITVDLDDVLGQQVPHCLRWTRWHVRAEYIVEAPILPDYNDEVTDWRARIADYRGTTVAPKGFAVFRPRGKSRGVGIPWRGGEYTQADCD